MAEIAAMHRLSFLSAAYPLLRHPSWWQQQGWIIGGEALLGLLAGWALVRGLPLWQVGMGLAVVSATEGGMVWALNRWGRVAATGAIITLTALLAQGVATREGTLQWACLAGAVGITQGFSMLQGQRALGWIALKARKHRAAPAQALAASWLIGGVLLALGMAGAGLATQQWPPFPYLVVLIMAGVLIPIEWKEARPLPAATSPEASLSFYNRLSVFYNLLGAIVRRFIAPLAILSIAAYAGRPQHALGWLGALMGVMGLVGLAARMAHLHYHNRHSDAASYQGKGPFVMGLTGWLLMSAGLAGLSYVPALTWAWAALLLAGWTAAEAASRLSSVALYEGVRINCCSKGRLRPYRAAVGRLMVWRGLATALGYAAVGLVDPRYAAIAVGAAALGGLAFLGARGARPFPGP